MNGVAARRAAPAGSLDAALLARVRLEAAAGVGLDSVTLARVPGRAARAVRLAATVGAPMGDVLAAAAEAVDDDDRGRRELRVATAQARLVQGGLVAMPLLLVPALDLLLGLPLLAFYGTPTGRAVGFVGAGLVVLGALVSAAIVRSVGRPVPGAPVDEAADLLAACLTAGLPASAAMREVARVLPEVADDLHRGALAAEHGSEPSAAGRQGGVSEALGVLSHAEQLGVPAATPLRELARRQRADVRAVHRVRAEQVPGKLVAPSVLLLVPATVLVLGAPIVAHGLGGA